MYTVYILNSVQSGGSRTCQFPDNVSQVGCKSVKKGSSSIPPGGSASRKSPVKVVFCNTSNELTTVLAQTVQKPMK